MGTDKGFTYEYGTSEHTLETFEWDRTWIERANRHDAKRVLYIGDSISNATLREATLAAENQLLFDGFATSKALDNPYFAPALRLFAAEEGMRSAVVFNNGLHGWHLEDGTAYADAYERMIRFLLKEFEGTPLVLLTSTPVRDPERNARVERRNEAVRALAEKYGLLTVDFYAVLADRREELLLPDGVHFCTEGYKALAKILADTLLALL